MNQVQTIATSNQVGQKQILLSKKDTISNITQVAIGTLQPGEIVPSHTHTDMEESFYFMQGEGVYRVGDNIFPIEQGVFIHIPTGVAHGMQASGNTSLKFIYWGIAIKKGEK